LLDDGSMASIHFDIDDDGNIDGTHEASVGDLVGFHPERDFTVYVYDPGSGDQTAALFGTSSVNAKHYQTIQGGAAGKTFEVSTCSASRSCGGRRGGTRKNGTINVKTGR
jgi:hypothetical protein